ncbi:hypothetical protein [Corynebacterium casei]|uniref:hypothetical protein n=2 Tax=Corynebacterium casei TaxID=160386 RepID=UPI003F94BBFE
MTSHQNSPRAKRRTARGKAMSRGASLTVALSASIALLTGCAMPGGPGAPTATTSSAAPGFVQEKDVEILEDENLAAAMEQIVSDVEDKYGATVSLAVVGDTDEHLAGDEGTEPAWSTIKVPIAIAALRDGADESLVDAAIKESDNDAAYALWQQVEWTEGSAIESIEKLLNDFESDVEMDQAFGMSTWKVKAQARFASRLGCVPESEYVYDAMQDIVEWQKWGLSGLGDVHSKGGWGLDDSDGEYTSRQMGVMPVDGGEVGIAISTSWMTWDDDMAFLDDTEYDSVEDVSAAALDEIASRLETLIDKALETGELKPVDDCFATSTSHTPTEEESTEEASVSEASAEIESEEPTEEESAESTEEPSRESSKEDEE